ncbi:uncharacterized protein MYCFIDRAFT_208761 [Pseudocercospora fijiensis CIRAD86]|uniref:Uncharacterized protein n=1 Tax=Pseudocercospora fijiensis (strain CIRAD86) TaxID=383855 RepID=M3APH7_PSEFD|nr:uncharacterized protein MYCFIDRAFT_208761 [Pseudocercospora fijiensis CIRAD86]EME79332.1 hypothetical protein MYCFIDRAFT_208761 [Pseudocercospora fijiensis CIRAD86]
MCVPKTSHRMQGSFQAFAWSFATLTQISRLVWRLLAVRALPYDAVLDAYLKYEEVKVSEMIAIRWICCNQSSSGNGIDKTTFPWSHKSLRSTQHLLFMPSPSPSNGPVLVKPAASYEGC